MVSNEDEAVAEIALVGDDKETIKSKLQYTVVATNADLVAPDGLVLRKTGSRRNLDITPLENAFGETDITVTVNDGIDEVSTTFKLTINAVNDPPTISAVEPIEINEDQMVSFTVTLTDIDTAPEELKITGNAANAALLPSDNITSTGEGLTRTVTLSPGANMGGKTKVTLSVNDGDNTVSTETELTVIPVVDIPVALPQELTTKYGKHLPLTLAGTDPDSLGLSFHLVEMPKNGSLIGTAPNLTYRPKAGFEGMDTFQFRVVAGEYKSEPETIVITVLGLGKGDQPILSLARSNDGGLTISWVGEGVLQSSTDLKNWESIENAAKPHTVDPADARRFYRMVQP